MRLCSYAHSQPLLIPYTCHDPHGVFAFDELNSRWRLSSPVFGVSTVILKECHLEVPQGGFSVGSRQYIAHTLPVLSAAGPVCSDKVSRMLAGVSDPS